MRAELRAGSTTATNIARALGRRRSPIQLPAPLLSRHERAEARTIRRDARGSHSTAHVADSRLWLDFCVNERRRSDGAVMNSMDSSTGKSGGQKAKMAFTILAASLLAQYGLADDPDRADSFRLVVVDEVFSRTDAQNSHRALELFQRLGFQLLLAAPWKAEARIAEKYVSSFHLTVNPNGDASRVRRARNTMRRARKRHAMFSRDELLAQARRRYPDFLRSIIEGTDLFPLEMRVGKTRRAESYAARVAELDAFRAAAASLCLTVEWRTVNDPRFGTHERPERAFFADEAALLHALGKAAEVRAFREDLARIRAERPALEPWLAANGMSIVAYHSIWPALLRCVRWFREHPRSGLYLRQIPVEGVDTKFFERRRGILHALLMQTQQEAIDVTMKEFEARHGLRWEEPLVRLRFLDPTLQTAHGFPGDWFHRRRKRALELLGAEGRWLEQERVPFTAVVKELTRCEALDRIALLLENKGYVNLRTR